jgi:hypothetical protein
MHARLSVVRLRAGASTLQACANAVTHICEGELAFASIEWAGVRCDQPIGLGAATTATTTPHVRTVQAANGKCVGRA